MTEKYLYANDVVKYLGVSRTTVYRWIAKRNLPAHRKGRFWTFKKTEIDAWKKISKNTDIKLSCSNRVNGKQKRSAKIQERFGFCHGRNSAHMARTMMLKELRLLLNTTPITSTKSDYEQAILEENCLGKRSSRTRKLSKRHLVNLYGLDPDITIFRMLRYFWQRDSEGRSLLACLCVYARDPLFRNTAPVIVDIDSDRLAAYSAARSQHFSSENPPPASTLIGVSGLVFPALQVEVEAIAVIEE